MRRLIIGMLVVLAASAAVIAYLDASDAQRQRIEQAGAIGRPITIPTDPRLSDPDTVFGMLRRAAVDARVNVLRTLVGYTADGRQRTTQYVLLTTGTHLFDAFNLRSGRWLTPDDADHPDRYLSDARSDSPEQVGVLNVFGIQPEISIRSLQRAFDSLPVAGTYVIEASDEASFDTFANSLAQRASALAGGPGAFTARTFTSSAFGGVGGQSVGGPGIVLGAVQFLIVFLTAIFLAFKVLHQAKKAGVMRLHGFGALDVWYEVAGRLLLVTLIASEAIALPATLLVPGTTLDFSRAVGLDILRAFAVMLSASLLTCAYVARAQIGSAIKNRKDTQGLFALNTMVKIGASALLIAAASGLWVLYTDAAAARDKFGNWDRARGYGVFTPRSVGNDFAEIVSGGTATTAALVFDLYPTLNDRGALYVDATQFEPPPPEQGAPEPSVATGPPYRSMKVNANYLERFPVLDAAGRAIEVGEGTTDWVVLAPIHLRDQEQQIRAFFQGVRTGDGGAIQSNGTYGRPMPTGLAHQKVAIVWTADGQSVFSFNPLVNPGAGNNIVDPIVEVMTTSNSVGDDRGNMMSGGIDSALKMPLQEGDAARTLQGLEPLLKSLKLDDNYRYLVTIDGWVAQQIATIDLALRLYAGVALGLLVGLLMLSVQSVSIMFERYSRRITVRRLFGAGFAQAYREVVLLFGVSWGLQLGGALIANRLGVNPFATAPASAVAPATGVAADGVIVVVTAAIALLEWLLSVVVLTRIERGGVVRVLKQEF